MDCVPNCLLKSGFLFIICRSSLIRSFVSLSAESKISISSNPMTWSLLLLMCWWQAELVLFRCSLRRYNKILSVLPIYSAVQFLHFRLYTTSDLFSTSLTLSLNGKNFPISFSALKAKLKSSCGNVDVTSFFSLLTNSSALWLTYGRTMYWCFFVCFSLFFSAEGFCYWFILFLRNLSISLST